MAKDWNEHGFFSGITEDYSNYRWFKGEKENPYTDDQKRPLAALFWQYEREFHLNFLGHYDGTETLSQAYQRWKAEFLSEHLPGKSPNPFGDQTDWAKVFEKGSREL